MMVADIMELSKMGSDMGLANTISQMETSMKGCGILTKEM
jgi:hypothetical protein